VETLFQETAISTHPAGQQADPS